MKKMLFVCVGNSCRSQMAEGFAKHLGGRKPDVKSVGLSPALAVSGKAIQVMAEKQVDISGQYPKPLFFEDIQWADKVIVMGNDVKDPWIERDMDKMEDWGIDDPIGQPVERYREIRDEIEAKVRGLLERLMVY